MATECEGVLVGVHPCPVRGSVVVVGLGPVDGEPVAYIALCPGPGVDGLIADLRAAAGRARPGHHHGFSGPNRAERRGRRGQHRG